MLPVRLPMSLFVCLTSPTPGMQTEANAACLYTHPPSGTKYPRMQIITVKEIFEGKRLEMPAIESPFKRAKPEAPTQQVFDFVSEET